MAPRTSIRTSNGALEIIDQLLLPHTNTWVPIRSVEEAHGAIKRMQIRGAPAIASLAALALADELERGLASEHPPQWLSSLRALAGHVGSRLDYLYTSRPTAVNLGTAIRRLRRVLDAGDKSAREVAEDLAREAHAVADEDVGRNREMSRHGAEWLLERVKKAEGGKRKLRVMTVSCQQNLAFARNLLTFLTQVCNTGSLATSVGLLPSRPYF
jgi:methylthioribose-1-phosphate isomerase